MDVGHPNVQPHSTHCIWTSWTGGGLGRRQVISPGEEGDTQVFWRWLAQLHFITLKNETTKSSPQFTEAVWQGLGASARACGPQAWPCTTLETTETEACRGGSEEITLDAVQRLKMAQPVPGVWSPMESQQSRRGWSNPRARW